MALPSVDPVAGLVPISEFRRLNVAVLEQARRSQRPIIVTRNGTAAAIIVAPELWARAEAALAALEQLETPLCAD